MASFCCRSHCCKLDCYMDVTVMCDLVTCVYILELRSLVVLCGRFQG